MAYFDLSFSQQYAHPVQAGFQQLPAGQALGLQPRQAGVLRVGQGGLWLTSSRCAGDHFLSPGQHWAAQAGEQLVIEPWQLAPGQSARFAWDATAPATPLRSAWQAARRGMATALGLSGRPATAACGCPGAA